MRSETSNRDLIARLRTERDELRVRMHLAKAELREEWATLEKKWTRLENRLSQARTEAKSASKDVGSAAESLAGEIASAYRRIRDRLH